ncbi:MAG: hypothetical protein EPO58_00965 [Chitinophagaceae bacterium]|nr:MAG: hypothetical protein EPO58_00965 [Chitinophagaceae bacterium]
MKYIFNFLLILFISLFAITRAESQSVLINKVTDSNVIKIIPNIKSCSHFYHKELGITVLEVTNETGSANLDESEEVTTDLFIGVSEADENPRQNCFRIKDLYGITDIKLEKSETSEAILSFFYIDLKAKVNKRKQVKIRLNLDQANVI